MRTVVMGDFNFLEGEVLIFMFLRGGSSLASLHSTITFSCKLSHPTSTPRTPPHMVPPGQCLAALQRAQLIQWNGAVSSHHHSQALGSMFLSGSSR